MERFLDEHRVRHFALNISPQVHLLASALVRWRRIIAEFQPEVVHVHVPLAAAVARTATSYVTVATVHNSFRRSSLLMSLADEVVSVSAEVAKDLQERRWFGHRSRIILNGVVGSPRSSTLQDAGFTLKQPSIVCVGSLSERKGTDILLAAFAKVRESVPNAHLYLVGSKEKDNYGGLVERLGLDDAVTATGFESNPHRYLNTATVAVQPSRRDPFPLAVLEAKAAGRAIIGSEVDGIPQALSYGESGILVPVADVDALADSIWHLLTDESERRRLEEASLADAAKFTVERMAGEYEDLYKEVLSTASCGR
jgi:glycosyltransferase involved in cell wall biosynthesis